MSALLRRPARIAAALAVGPVLGMTLGAASSPVPRHALAAYRGFLTGVSAVSRTSAWAVGSYQTAQGRRLILHWNGTAWRTVRSPDPHHAGLLNAVSARSRSDAWAVGSYCINCSASSREFRPFILHWNGTAWAQVPAPQPRGAVIAGLQGVSARSASDAWAVGSYCLRPTCFPGGHPTHPLILHWNGIRWTRVPSPEPGRQYGTSLTAVAALSAADAWAVGDYGGKASPVPAERSLVLHWNGTRWAKVASPSRGVPPGTGLECVSAISRADVWAAGSSYFYQPDQQKSMIMRWDGAAWTQVRSPSPGPDSGTIFTPVNGISALSPTSAWAVGSRYISSTRSGRGTLVLHWNGTRWRVVPSPSPSHGNDNSLAAVSALSPASAWAVGAAGLRTLILHWNGRRWTRS